MTKADRIKALRIKAKMTQEQVAQKLGTTKQTIYKYETGIITNIPTDKIEQLATLFETTPLYITGWNEKEPATSKDDELINAINSRPLLRQLMESLSHLDDEHLKAFVTVAGVPAPPKDV